MPTVCLKTYLKSIVTKPINTSRNLDSPKKVSQRTVTVKSHLIKVSRKWDSWELCLFEQIKLSNLKCYSTSYIN